MRILFMGTPDFAAVSLATLIENKFDVVAVVTNPDKPKGRGHKLVKSDVKIEAEKHNLPIFQPESLRHGELQEVLDEYKPDIICVVAYGKILPKYVLDYPKMGCINVHGSLLPKYRGAAPIQWSVLNGEKYAGVTTMLMNEGLDTGDMLLTEKVEIGETETSEQLFDRLAPIGGRLLCETLEKLGEIEPIAQNDAESTYAPMIDKEMAKIDWNESAEKIDCKIRGMNSWPMAYTYYNGEAVKIISATKTNESVNKEPGTILPLVKGKGLPIVCKNGCIYIVEAQFAGSKRMNIEDYLRGHSLDLNKFGE